MDAETLQFSIGSLVTLGGIAAGYGALKSRVKQIAEDLEEESARRILLEREVTKLTLWRAQLKGERYAKDRRLNRQPSQYPTETGEFCNGDSGQG